MILTHLIRFIHMHQSLHYCFYTHLCKSSKVVKLRLKKKTREANSVRDQERNREIKNCAKEKRSKYPLIVFLLAELRVLRGH